MTTSFHQLSPDLVDWATAALPMVVTFRASGIVRAVVWPGVAPAAVPDVDNIAVARVFVRRDAGAVDRPGAILGVNTSAAREESIEASEIRVSEGCWGAGTVCGLV